jgi:serine protease inhibitor
MKQLTFISILVLVLAVSCDNEPDPEFDYNLKSAKVITTNNDFGLELLNAVLENEERENIMISPASVSLALGMTYNGAEGYTLAAFEEVLNYEGLSREEVNEISRELIHVLFTNSKGNLVEIANSVWYREGFPVKPEFIDLNSTYFDARTEELDFNSPNALTTINNWVKDKTHDKIEEILDNIDPSTAMILINALYFNCLWEIEFDKDDTYDAPFYNEDGTRIAIVDMMSVEENFKTGWGDNYRAVELPYKNGKFSMFLFLPDEGTGVKELIHELNGDTWNLWTEAFAMVNDYVVELPRFEFEYGKSLKPELMEMGLAEAFSGQADFSSISDIPLFISDVIHKTYIKVDEKGTEAAAVTAVTMDLTSAGPGSVLRFDRPFLFAITENTSKSILFTGIVGKP